MPKVIFVKFEENEKNCLFSKIYEMFECSCILFLCQPEATVNLPLT